MLNLRQRFPGIAAAAIAAAVVGFIANDGHLLFKGPPSDAEIDRLIAESEVGATYDAMKTYFPDKAAEWRATLGELVIQRRKGLYNTASAINAGAELRRDYAHHLATAPDDLLVQVIGQQHALYATFRDSPDACGRFLLEGPVALTAVERQRLTPFLNDAGLLFEAMHAGMTAPVSRAPTSEAEWVSLFRQMRDAGLSDADIDLIANPDPAAPRYCDAFLGFLDALATADFEGADRLRAEMAVAMISS